MRNIPYNKQYVDKDDINYVSKALKADLITTGQYVKSFENKIKIFLKAKFAVSCSSGTSALHLALLAIDLKKGDVIVMPAINFIAVYNLSKIIGAKIFLADVDSFTGQMTPKTLLECIKKNKLNNIKVIITMYLGGFPENVLEFYKIKNFFKCFIIEDACHALGAKYKFKGKDVFIGSCKHSDLATFSLHPVKTITTGEGGLVTTSNTLLYNRIISLRSHGIVRKKTDNHWSYNISSPGFNYRLSDINCALGLSQLKKIEKFINYRKKIYSRYKIFFKKLNNLVSLSPYDTKNKPSYHLFIISISFFNIKKDKDNFFKYLKKNNIIAQYHYIPIYKFSIFGNKNNNFFPGAEFYYNHSISLPIFYKLNYNKHNYILKKIFFYFKKFI
jgi:dTDP-4-amino-4,6-dideoxygalactose transaminase